MSYTELNKLSSYAFMSKLISSYQDGILTDSDLEHMMFWRAIDTIMAHVKKSPEPLMWFTSSCGSEPPPPETVNVEIKVHGTNVTITPVPYRPF